METDEATAAAAATVAVAAADAHADAPEVPINADYVYMDALRAHAGEGEEPCASSAARMQPRPDVQNAAKARGLHAEARFLAWAQRTWPDATCWTACTEDNMTQHWDIRVQSAASVADGTPGVRVDVKAARKRARGDDSVDTTHTWLELQSADVAHRGSLFGDAELFAFEDQHGAWTLVSRARLARVVMEQLEARDMRCSTTSSDATAAAACFQPTPCAPTCAPVVLYNRRDAERLLWFPLSELQRLAIDVDTVPLREIERAFAAVAKEHARPSASAPSSSLAPVPVPTSVPTSVPTPAPAPLTPSAPVSVPTPLC